MIKYAEEKNQVVRPFRQIESRVQISAGDLHLRVQSRFQRADSAHLVEVRFRVVYGDHSKTKRFEKEGDVSVGAADIKGESPV